MDEGIRAQKRQQLKGLNRLNKLSLCFIFILFVCVFGASAAISPDFLSKISSATYSAVGKQKDGTYTDLGTAVLMENGLFYTSAAAFNLFSESIFEDYFVKDQNQKYYKIKNIINLSTSRDILCFDTETKPSKKGLSASSESDKGLTSAYSVKASLKDGITLEICNFLGKFYEKERQEWEWLYFSSERAYKTGIIVNENAELIGFITSKSDENNTVFVLPFEETEYLRPDIAVINQTFAFSLPNIYSQKFTQKIRTELPLPASVSEINQKLSAQLDSYFSKFAASIQKNFGMNSSRGFLKARGSSEIRSSASIPDFPYTICLDENSKWAYYFPDNLQEELAFENGYIVYGTLFDFTLTFLNKASSHNLEDFLLDQSLIAKYMTSTVFPEDYDGEPSSTEVFVDELQRKWIVNYWSIDEDTMIMTLALPLPQGLYVMSDKGTVSQITNTSAVKMKFLASFVYPPYAADLEEWIEYLALLKEYDNLYGGFDSVTLDYDQKSFRFDSDLFKLKLPSDVFSVNETTTFRIALGYDDSSGKTQLKIRSLDLFSPPAYEDYKCIFVSQILKPDDNAEFWLKQQWEEKKDKVYPYTGTPYDYEQFTYYDEIVYPKGFTSKNRDKLTELYYFACELKGNGKKKEIKALAKSIKKDLTIKE